MERQEVIKRIYSLIDEIPTLPAVVPKLLSLFEQEDADARKIARLISEDPALTANVLKVANSAYYGFPGRITGLEHAVMLLGFNMVRALTLSVGVIKSLPESKDGFLEETLWLHSIRVATSMEELGKQFSMPSDERGYIFIIGLLHDIGKVLFDLLFPDQYKELLDTEQDFDTASLSKKEISLFGINHAEAGSLLLKRWNFPEIIWMPIGFHHSDNLPEGIDNRLLSLLRLSDMISLNYETPEDLCPEDCKAELETLSLEEDVLFTTAHSLKEAEERIRAFYLSLH
ncbi:MAG: HDOD domain-containing protein [Nitrospirae bacterium]|nr:MAG: HDOD domain-containing protein [Nitrospirota bacterium]